MNEFIEAHKMIISIIGFSVSMVAFSLFLYLDYKYWKGVNEKEKITGLTGVDSVRDYNKNGSIIKK